jgi:membrane protease subunit HflC
MKRTPLTLAVAFVLIVIFGTMLFFYQVRKSQVAVVTFFGKVVHVKSEPGLGFRLPWPIENIIKLDERVQNFDGKFEQIKLNDQNILMLSVYVGYKISEADVFFRKWPNGSIAEAEKALEALVRSSKNEVAGRHNFPDFISTDTNQMKFGQIEQEILQEVQRRLESLRQGGSSYGVEIKFIQIKKIGLPETVTETVFKRMTSEREFYISQIQSDGELQATRIKSEADKQANTLLYDANAQAFAIRGAGEAQMMKSLAVMQENPELATFNMQIQALEEFLQKKTTLVLDLSTSPLQWLKMSEPANKDNDK